MPQCRVLAAHQFLHHGVDDRRHPLALGRVPHVQRVQRGRPGRVGEVQRDGVSGAMEQHRRQERRNRDSYSLRAVQRLTIIRGGKCESIGVGAARELVSGRRSALRCSCRRNSKRIVHYPTEWMLLSHIAGSFTDSSLLIAEYLCRPWRNQWAIHPHESYGFTPKLIPPIGYSVQI